MTAAITGAAASLVLNISLLEGMLLGSIVSVTDTAAIFGLLRHSRLRPKVARALEGEAGLNDPVAVLLVVGFIDWIQMPGYGVGDMALLFARELGHRRGRWGRGRMAGRSGAAPCLARH